MAKKKSNGSRSTSGTRPSSSKQRATQGEGGSYAQVAAVPPPAHKEDAVVKQETESELQETKEEQAHQQGPTNDPAGATNPPSSNQDVENAKGPAHTSSAPKAPEDDESTSTAEESKEEAQESRAESKAAAESWDSGASDGLEPSPPPNKSELPDLFEASQREASVERSKSSRHHRSSSSTSPQCPTYSPTSTVSKHVAFFDRDQDGIITPADTFGGFRELGFGLIFSFFAAVFIHGGFSMPSWGWRWDWQMRCRVEGMSLCKHGSDSGVYNVAGNMDEPKFVEMWKNWSKDGETMDKNEIRTMVADHRVVFDPFGWTAAIFEWGTTYLMIWPQDGKIRKGDVEKLYTGELFWEIAGERKKVHSGRKNKKHA